MKINEDQMECLKSQLNRITDLLKEFKQSNNTDVFWREWSIDDGTIDHFICTVDDISMFIGSEWANDFIDKDVYMRKNGYDYKVDLRKTNPIDETRKRIDKTRRSVDYTAGYADGIAAGAKLQ